VGKVRNEAREEGLVTVYLDVSAAVHHRAGLGRYAENLARALAPLLPDHLALFYNREAGIEPLPGLESLPSRSVALGYKPWRMAVWLGQIAHVGFNRLVPDATLFHAAEHLLLPLHGVPSILTVHDLIFRHLPEHHKPLNRWYLNLAMPLYCRRAAHIIAISGQTRRDLVSAYGIPADKISVIYEAADARFRPQTPAAIGASRSRYHLPERYLLFVGTVEPRKNLTRLLAAFERLHAEGLTDGLAVVGKRGWLYDDFFAALERSPSKAAVLFPGYVPDEDLPAVYAGAQALVMPSLYEGFGLPVLEAMACAAPVACSNGSSLSEIAGDAAALFDPTDVDSIGDALRRILCDADLQVHLRDIGARHANGYSWSRAAEETLAVYRRFAHEQ
jgi:glycosyltransferase involved in cell wall biosynthesis